jgi:hypothetical protein
MTGVPDFPLPVWRRALRAVGRNYVFNANYVFDVKIRARVVHRQDDRRSAESIRVRMFRKYHEAIV